MNSEQTERDENKKRITVNRKNKENHDKLIKTKRINGEREKKSKGDIDRTGKRRQRKKEHESVKRRGK